MPTSPAQAITEKIARKVVWLVLLPDGEGGAVCSEITVAGGLVLDVANCLPSLRRYLAN